MGLRDEVIWWGGLVALPVLIGQALYTRRRTPRLPAPPPPARNTAAGVGVARSECALAGRLAVHLASRLDRPVTWEALGLAGADAGDCLSIVKAELAPRLANKPADLVVIVLGVNDTKNLTPRARWRDELGRIVSSIRETTRCRLLLVGVPPMQQFSALPLPLGWVLGARARLLDEDMRRVCESKPNCQHVPTRPDIEPRFLAVDGFHPSEAGYDAWAQRLAEHWVIWINEHPDPHAATAEPAG